MSRRLIKKLDMLMIVDLDEGDANIAAVLLGERVGLVKAQKIMPERNRLRRSETK